MPASATLRQTTNNLGDYIPIAVPDTQKYPGTDYYEIGLVQYRHQFSSDLPPTLQRGYVQLESADFVAHNPGVSNHAVLTNANLDPNTHAVTDISTLMPDGTTTVWGSQVMIDGAQAYGVDMPRYLGPTIVATKDRPVRVLFRNLLPNGEAGDLFLPVDTTLMGSGMGPNAVTLDANGVPDGPRPHDLGSVLDAVRNPMCGDTPKADRLLPREQGHATHARWCHPVDQ